MQALEDIKPKKKLMVFDLVEQAGFDMSDWIESSNDPRGFKANPKYCYEWSFVQPGVAIVLNLWHETMTIEEDNIAQRGNFRADAKTHQGPGGKVQWLQRATKLDEALQTALTDNLPVKVIINSGERREPGESKASRVLCRELDPTPWTIVEYDWKTGAHAIKRGIIDRQFADQFDIEQSVKADPERKEQNGFVFIRNPKVRAEVKRRSNGYCEFCGEMGFEMSSGALYLETHHIVSLAEGGNDTIGNVIALCPRDHRMAHYSRDVLTRRTEMVRIVANAMTQ
jgi:5-methylcytosine-specific restriction protein A